MTQAGPRARARAQARAGGGAQLGHSRVAVPRLVSHTAVWFQRQAAPPSFDGSRPPPPTALDDQRDELDALGTAQILRLQVRALVGFISGHRPVSVREQGVETARAQPSGDCKVEGNGPMDPPVWKVNVRRTAAIAVPRIFWQAILVGPGRQKTGPCDLGMKASSLRTGRQHGAQAVVSLGPVPAAGAAERVVTEAVSDSVAEGAGHIGCSDREAKTELDEDAEQGRSNVKAERLTRRSMEPRPGMRLPLELQVGTEGFTASAVDKELLDHSAIQRLRQRLLSGRRRRGDRDMVGGQHELVVEGSGSVEEWPSGGVARVQALSLLRKGLRNRRRPT